MKMYLIGMDQDHSHYIRDLIDRDRLDRLDSTIINNKIKEHQKAIKDLQGLKKEKTQDDVRIKELLEYHAPNYKRNAERRLESQRIHFIEKAIMPQLRKYGFKGSPEEIDKLLLE